MILWDFKKFIYFLMFNEVDITNPKILKHTGRNLNYYAGYSETFVYDALSSVDLPPNARILDPWNGIGTTTTVSSRIGLKSVGIDINPVMQVCASAALICSTDFGSLKSLTSEIIEKLKRCSLKIELSKDDPLLHWIAPGALAVFRELQLHINQLLVSKAASLEFPRKIELSRYAAFFYLCCFKTLRKFTIKFKSSNPTWIKRPKDLKARVRPSVYRIIDAFQAASDSILDSHVQSSVLVKPNLADIRVASSTATGIDDNSIDLIVTSPPYCTRIDYAVSTQIELAFLNFSLDELRELRNQMIGTSTIGNSNYADEERLGEPVGAFLNELRNHESKASASYYYKAHYQYYDSMYESLAHLSKDTLRIGGGLIIVVQDSYYKDVHNDLQSNLIDMAEIHGLALRRRFDFKNRKSLASLNPNANKYKERSRPTESVLCFQKI